ncbi:MAG: polysaccharide biosynthesis tyrosine autokinase [Thermodesulfobacteriota bacterium]
MRQKLDKNYYDLLDIGPDASVEDIESGYRRAMELYEGDSAATYSLYTAEEKKALVDMLKTAYETLRDPAKRTAYDSMMAAPVLDDEPCELDMDELRAGLVETDHSAYFRKPAIGIKTVVELKAPFSLTDSADQMVAEQYRILYMKLEEMRLDKGYRAFAITSAVKDEGKSVTSFNLAYLMAMDFKKRTILVEADLRKASTVNNYLKKPGQYGLADVLSGRCDLHSAIVNVEGTSLYMLPTGSLTKKSSELIGSQRMKSAMSTIKAEFEYIIVDSPPILPLVDVSILSKLVDGLLIVVRAGKTSRNLVVKALDSVSNANPLGVILNGADTKLKRYYY